MSQPPTIQLNPIQLLQITDKVLAELRLWIEKKPEAEVSHSDKDRTAIASLHHARLLCGLRLREIATEIHKRQEAERQRVATQLPTPNQLNMAAARVLGVNSASKTIDDLWREAGLSHYLDTGRP